MTQTSPQQTNPTPATIRKAVAAAALGNAMEWYDYGVFTAGAMTSTIGTIFFPGQGDAVLKSLAMVAVGFVARPFGGLVFGPLGDKLGRRRVLAVTIVLMSLCTALVGVLPTASAIGVGAPLLLLLLRLVQGFSTGGEYGGAATFIAEYAPTQRRGFFGSFLEIGTLSGYVAGNAIVLVMLLVAGDAAQLRDTGLWRVPFLIALPMGGIGLYLRTRLDDTPAFLGLKRKRHQAALASLRATLVGNWRMILNLMGIVLLLNIADYMLLTTMPSYLTQHLHVGDTTSALIVIGVELAQMTLLAPLGALSDRIGRKPLLAAAAIGYIMLSLPAIRMMQGGGIAQLVTGYAVMAFLLALMLAVVGSALPAMFPTTVRYGSFAIGYNLSTSLFGGTCGVIVEALINRTGDNNIPAYYLVVAASVALLPILFMPETARVPIQTIGGASGQAVKSPVRAAVKARASTAAGGAYRESAPVRVQRPLASRPPRTPS